MAADAMGDPVFGAIEHPLSPFFYRGAAHIAGITAGVGFSKTPGAKRFPTGEAGGGFFFLCFIAKGKKMSKEKGVLCSQAKAAGAPDPGDLLCEPDKFTL